MLDPTSSLFVDTFSSAMESYPQRRLDASESYLPAFAETQTPRRFVSKRRLVRPLLLQTVLESPIHLTDTGHPLTAETPW